MISLVLIARNKLARVQNLYLYFQTRLGSRPTLILSTTLERERAMLAITISSSHRGAGFTTFKQVSNNRVTTMQVEQCINQCYTRYIAQSWKPTRYVHRYTNPEIHSFSYVLVYRYTEFTFHYFQVYHQPEVQQPQVQQHYQANFFQQQVWPLSQFI